MRILTVDGADHYGVGGALRGHEMGYALKTLGHDIRVVTPGQDASEALMAEVKPDACIFTGTWHQLLAGYSGALAGSQVADSLGIPAIWWYGSNGSLWGSVSPDAEERKASLNRIISLLMARQFITVICPYSMEIYAKYGIPKEKMRLVPSVFDGDLFSPISSAQELHVSKRLRHKFQIPDKAFCIGTVGHTPNSKGGDEVIQAVSLLKDEMPDLHYLILHTPELYLSKTKARSPDGKRLGNAEYDVLQISKGLSSTLGVNDRVHFLGMRFPREAMPMFYRLLRVYCSPSKAENLGQPLVESQLCGMPLVTFQGFSFDFVACPHTAQQIKPSAIETDDYGLVIPMADPADVADAIRKARHVAESNSQDVTRTWAYEKFHHHNAKTMVEAIEEYRGLLTGSPVSRQEAQEGPKFRAGDTIPSTCVESPAVAAGRDEMAIGYAAAAARIEIEIGKPTGAFLDVGCSSGEGVVELKRLWPEIVPTGIECVPVFANRARGLCLAVTTGEMERMPFANGQFAFCFARHSLEHSRNRQAAIEECWRVIRPGGHLYIQSPIEPDGSANVLHLSPFRSAAEIRGIGDLLAGAQEIYWGPQETVAELILRKLA